MIDAATVPGADEVNVMLICPLSPWPTGVVVPFHVPEIAEITWGDMVLEPFVEVAAGLLGAVGSAAEAPQALTRAERRATMKNARFTILSSPMVAALPRVQLIAINKTESRTAGDPRQSSTTTDTRHRAREPDFAPSSRSFSPLRCDAQECK